MELVHSSIDSVFEWPRRILFWPDALGTNHPFSIGPVTGELFLPSLSVIKSRGFPGENQLLPPEGLAHLDADWGVVVARPVAFALVKTLGFKVFVHHWNGVKPNDLQFEQCADSFARAIDPWLQQVRTWLAAIVGEDLVVESPSDLPGYIPPGLRAYAPADPEKSVAEPANLIEPTGQSWDTVTSRAVNLASWSRAIRLANAGAVLPVEYELLNSARSALAKGRMRVAVLEAGIGADISLRAAITTRLRAHNEPEAVDAILARKTFGALASVAKRFGVWCPPSLQVLLQARNAAAHRGSGPPVDEAVSAINIAAELVSHHTALPS